MSAARNLSAEDSVLWEIASAISKISGNQFGPKTEAMLRSRLTKRCRDLGMADFIEYQQYWREHQTAENEHLISLLTTHHTFFYREYSHFEWLQGELPKLISQIKAQGRKELSIWCAACSMGQEVYSFATFLKYHLSKIAPEIGFKIVGTDIDPKSVQIAKNGVYRWTESARVPSFILNTYFRRGTGEISSYMKVVNEVRDHCSFGIANLLDSKSYPPGEFDLVICRNVFIYFSATETAQVAGKLLERCHRHGHLIIGLSESLGESRERFHHEGRSIYCRPMAVGALSTPSVGAPSSSVVLPQKVERPLRVVCVDDSSTVLTLLKKILSKEHGFEVVGTAENGRVAQELLKKVQADVMTLDIHMPEVNGVEYLALNFNPSHVPVVMVSSVARDDANHAFKSLQLGASDYVEKPSLQNLAQVAEELRAKLKFAFAVKSESKSLQLTKEFIQLPVIGRCEEKISLWMGSGSNLLRAAKSFQELAKPQPPVVYLATDRDELIQHFIDQHILANASRWQPGEPLVANRIYLVPRDQWAQIFGAVNSRRIHALLVGQVAGADVQMLRALRPSLTVTEDAPGSPQIHADYVVPLTSFAYESDRRFAEDKK